MPSVPSMIGEMILRLRNLVLRLQDEVRQLVIMPRHFPILQAVQAFCTVHIATLLRMMMDRLLRYTPFQLAWIIQALDLSMQCSTSRVL